MFLLSCDTTIYGGAADAYAIAGDSPELVADFPADYFRKAGSSTTFAGLFTYVGASSKYYRDSSGYVQEKTAGNARLHHYQWSGAAWVDKGILIESEARTNLLTYSDDLTNSIYTKTNITATKDQTGADNVANSATRLTASAANGTCLATSITSGSANHVYSALVKRITGTGTIEITLDNGTTWEDVTSDIITGEYLRVATAYQTIADPDVGFRIVTSGDEIAVQFSQVEVAVKRIGSSPIPTSGGTATRTAETLTIAGADTPANTTAMSFHMKGTLDYADTGGNPEVGLFSWASGTPRVEIGLKTSSFDTGEISLTQHAGTNYDNVLTGNDPYSPGTNVAFNVASRDTSSALNVAAEGLSGTENATPTSLADLSSSVLEFCDALTSHGPYIGTIDTFRLWGKDIADSGIETAST